MVIKNKTKNKTLSENATEAKTFLQKSFGLIRESKGTAMIFQTRFGIHTFFMQYPIDVLILDKENKIVAMKENLQSNKLFVWDLNFDKVIELPAGTINQSSTEIHDKISFSQ